MNKKMILLVILGTFLITGCTNIKKMTCVQENNEEKNELIFSFKKGKVIKLENVYTFNNKDDAYQAYDNLLKTAVDGSSYKINDLKVSYVMSKDELESYNDMTIEEVKSFVETKSFSCENIK